MDGNRTHLNKILQGTLTRWGVHMSKDGINVWILKGKCYRKQIEGKGPVIR
jgi:hypothetical protein